MNSTGSGNIYNSLKSSITEWSEKKKVFFVIFWVLFSETFGYGICIPNVPILASNLGATEATVGRIISVYSLVGFILLPLLGVLADRIRRKFIIAFSMALSCFYCLLFVTAQSTLQLEVARIVQGIAASSTWGGALPLFALYVSQAQRGWEMSLIGIAYGAGAILGPFFGGLAGPTIGFLFNGFLALSLCLITLILLKGEKAPDSSPTNSSFKEEVFMVIKSTFSLFRHACVLAPSIAVIGAYLTMGILETLFPLYAQRDLKHSLATVGLLFTGFYILFTAGQPFIGRWSDRVGRVLPMNSGLLIMACAIPIVFLSQNIVTWGFLLALIGLTLAAVIVTALPFISDGIDEEHRGRAYGLFMSSLFFGLWLGPLLGGLIAESFNNFISSLLGTGMLVVAAGLILMVTREKGPALT